MFTIKNLKLFTVYSLLVFLISCSDSDENSDKSITSFTIQGVDGVIDESTREILLVLATGTNLNSLSPTIAFTGSEISPASGQAQDFTNPVTYTVTAQDGSTADYEVTVLAQCVNPANVYAFTHNGKNYEVVRENKSWIESAACASELGGYLAEINNQAEQDAIFTELGNSSIFNTRTVASDGGSASYVWIGGNDLQNEGEWFWDGKSVRMGAPESIAKSLGGVGSGTPR